MLIKVGRKTLPVAYSVKRYKPDEAYLHKDSVLIHDQLIRGGYLLAGIQVR